MMEKNLVFLNFYASQDTPGLHRISGLQFLWIDGPISCPPHACSMSQIKDRVDSTQPASALSKDRIHAIIHSTGASAPLPPFRSAQEFPRKPKLGRLPELYADCMQALAQANMTRKILKESMGRKKRMISAIRLEIERLEKDLALEASTRTQLHAMNARLFEALQEMDDFVGDLDDLVHEAHRVPPSRLERLIGTLKRLFSRWQTFKRRLRDELASLEASQPTGGWR